MTESAENPFAAPQAPADQTVLSADTEFLVSDKCILCGDVVSLPRVCIHSGLQDELIPISRTLHSTPRWIVVLRAFFCVVSVFPAVELVNGFGPNFLKVETMYALAVIGFAGLFVLLGYWMKQPVECKWWVSKRSVEMAPKRGAMMMLIPGIFLGIPLVVSIFNSGLIGSLFALAIGLGVGMSWRSLKKRNPDWVAKNLLASPFLRGRHQGLFVLGGLSEKFLQQVQTIINQVDERSS